ncbi:MULTISPECIES: hypothetical protein [Nocardioides]|uniref:Endonuclease/exonuclease/phosphatase domain-containing protein n=1 Tax=Nocardioides vastitatis TaxID=2568655 RepID=A0ABW0ZKV0_9ACTN|nr:hypothetical protein [Nocardioides sp.]THJ01278.1 hypothetical protein E7Z54_11245 [Nocardioides sp.]
MARWNVHFVPGAWSTHRYARQALWLQQARMVRGLHAALASRGVPVFGGGDINRRNYPFPGDAVVYDASPRGGSTTSCTHGPDGSGLPGGRRGSRSTPTTTGWWCPP